MKIKIAKAYRTTSNEALCIDWNSEDMKAEETAKLCRITGYRQYLAQHGG
jgi:hypothetical protein